MYLNKYVEPKVQIANIINVITATFRAFNKIRCSDSNGLLISVSLISFIKNYLFLSMFWYPIGLQRKIFYVSLFIFQSFRNQSTLLLFLSSFLPGQPKSYRSIDLVRLPYLRNWDVSLFVLFVLLKNLLNLCNILLLFLSSLLLSVYGPITTIIPRINFIAFHNIPFALRPLGKIIHTVFNGI